MLLYLITHAHTHQVRDQAIDSWQLSPRGVEQARDLAREPWWDKLDRIVVSSEPKAWLTVAEVASARGLPVWIDSRFDELRRGGWVEHYDARVAQLFAAPETGRDGWESVVSVRNRALQGLADLERRFRGETLALVGHGLCLSILRAEMLGQAHVDFNAWQRLAFGTFALVDLNQRRLLQDFARSAQPER